MKMPGAGRSDVDYVLLMSGKDLHRHKSGSIRNTRPPKHFLLDAGTSTFDSSLYWFTWAFSQRRISFDSVLSWEMTLLEPTEYYSRIPPRWVPYVNYLCLELWLFLCPVIVIFHIECCTRKPWSTSIILYDSISIAYSHHTNLSSTP